MGILTNTFEIVYVPNLKKNNIILTLYNIIFRDNQTAVYFALKDRSPNNDYIEPFLRSTRSIR